MKTHIAPGAAATTATSLATTTRTLGRETFGKRSAHGAQGLRLDARAPRRTLRCFHHHHLARGTREQLALGYENFAALGKALQMDMGSMSAGAGVKTSPFQGPVVTRPARA
ncbi:hypothetical protein ACU4GD_38425 [Cupriavidus basilensis]